MQDCFSDKKKKSISAIHHINKLKMKEPHDSLTRCKDAYDKMQHRT